MDNSLNLKDLCDLVLSLNQEINWYWNFYVVSLIALLTFLSSKKFKLNKKEKTLLITVFCVFTVMNLMALIKTGRVASILVEELQFRVKNTATNLSSSTKDFILELPTKHGKYISIAVHAVVDPLMIFFMIALPSPQKRILSFPRENSEPE